MAFKRPKHGLCASPVGRSRCQWCSRALLAVLAQPWPCLGHCWGHWWSLVLLSSSASHGVAELGGSEEEDSFLQPRRRVTIPAALGVAVTLALPQCCRGTEGIRAWGRAGLFNVHLSCFGGTGSAQVMPRWGQGGWHGDTRTLAGTGQ